MPVFPEPNHEGRFRCVPGPAARSSSPLASSSSSPTAPPAAPGIVDPLADCPAARNRDLVAGRWAARQPIGDTVTYAEAVDLRDRLDAVALKAVG